jgi:hypothetical protein
MVRPVSICVRVDGCCRRLLVVDITTIATTTTEVGGGYAACSVPALQLWRLVNLLLLLVIFW